jgi:hypothetical protein
VGVESRESGAMRARKSGTSSAGSHENENHS